ncbi:MAG: hypothetical protein RBT65_11055 [Methanolobus sp.]|jgi:flavin-dependent dehydrogenase|nr:hypothetical protein [Methanolobus sp.]
MSYLDFEIPENIIERDIFGGRLRFGDKNVEYYKDYRVSAIVTRSAFDNFLLEKAREADIDIHLGENVTNISQDSMHVCVIISNATYQKQVSFNCNRFPGNTEKYCTKA